MSREQDREMLERAAELVADIAAARDRAKSKHLRATWKIEELETQLAAAEAEADHWEAEAQRYCTNMDYWREKCAATEADAERYRWWVKHGWFYRGPRCLQETGALRGEIGVGEGQTKKQAIDAAVDAAIIAAAPGAGGGE